MINSAVFVAALHPDETLVTYVRELAEAGVQKVIVADDGSGDEFNRIFQQCSEIPGCEVLPGNGEEAGVGATLKNAMQYYLDQSYDETYHGLIYAEYIGKYPYQDIELISGNIDANPNSLILAERKFDKNVYTPKRRGNTITKMIFDFMYGVSVKDPQTGLRGIPNACMEKLLQIPGERYEYLHDMVLEGKRKGVATVTVPLETVSTDEMVYTNRYPRKNEKKLYIKLISHFVKYIISTLGGFVIDMILFSIFCILLKKDMSYVYYIPISNLLARGCSSVYTFIVNRRLVFQSNDHLGKSLTKYYLLVGLQLFISCVFVTWLYSFIPLPENVIYMIVNICVFFLSFKLEKTVIFK